MKKIILITAVFFMTICQVHSQSNSNTTPPLKDSKNNQYIDLGNSSQTLNNQIPYQTEMTYKKEVTFYDETTTWFKKNGYLKVLSILVCFFWGYRIFKRRKLDRQKSVE